VEHSEGKAPWMGRPGWPLSRVLSTKTSSCGTRLSRQKMGSDATRAQDASPGVTPHAPPWPRGARHWARRRLRTSPKARTPTPCWAGIASWWLRSSMALRRARPWGVPVSSRRWKTWGGAWPRRLAPGARTGWPGPWRLWGRPSVLTRWGTSARDVAFPLPLNAQSPPHGRRVCAVTGLCGGRRTCGRRPCGRWGDA
jgi:hypothetical protein